MRRGEGEVTEEQKDQALMWMMFLPQALLRRPSRGKRAGRGQVNNRLQQGDWRALVDFQEKRLEEACVLA